MSKIGLNDLSAIYVGSAEVGKAYLGNSVVYEKTSVVPTDAVEFKSVSGSSTIAFTKLSSQQSFSGSTDGVTWFTMPSTYSITLPQGKSLFVKGVINSSNSETNYTNMAITGAVSVRGNIKDLTQGRTAPLYLTFFHFFDSCDIVDASGLVFDSGYITSQAFNSMFKDCKKLVNGPVSLPAVSSSYPNCFDKMFKGCSSLVASPVISGSTMPSYGANRMFDGCTALSRIDCYVTSYSSNNSFYSWTAGVAASGTFVKGENVTFWPIDSVNGIPVGWTVVERGTIPNTVMFKPMYACTVGMSHKSSARYIEYATDWENPVWNEFTIDTTVNLVSGAKLFLRGALFDSCSDTDYDQFTMSRNSLVEISGKLSDLSTHSGCTLSGKSYAHYRMFKGNPGVYNITNLDMQISTPIPYGYAEMFENCDGLAFMPTKLWPAVDVHSFERMFANCEDIEFVRSIRNIQPTTATFKETFADCMDLKFVNMEVRPGPYESSFEGMFSGCRNLEDASCIKFFPATGGSVGNKAFKSMFAGCWALVVSPILTNDSVGDNAYESMFAGCTALKHVECDTTTFGDNATLNWLSGTSSTGVVRCDPNITMSSDDSGIPTGWTRKSNAEYQQVLGLNFNYAGGSIPTYTLAELSDVVYGLGTRLAFNYASRAGDKCIGSQGPNDDSDFRLFANSYTAYFDFGSGRSYINLNSTTIQHEMMYYTEMLSSSTSRAQLHAVDTTPGGTNYLGNPTSGMEYKPNDLVLTVGGGNSYDSFTRFRYLILKDVNNSNIAYYVPFKVVGTDEPVLIDVLNDATPLHANDSNSLPVIISTI